MMTWSHSGSEAYIETPWELIDGVLGRRIYRYETDEPYSVYNLRYVGLMSDTLILMEELSDFLYVKEVTVGA